ncbi:Chromobox protein 1 [Dissophora globulifera]|nr:Chromobox protein 1 [Dissophora globulifera]
MGNEEHCGNSGSGTTGTSVSPTEHSDMVGLKLPTSILPSNSTPIGGALVFDNGNPNISPTKSNMINPSATVDIYNDSNVDSPNPGKSTTGCQSNVGISPPARKAKKLTVQEKRVRKFLAQILPVGTVVTDDVLDCASCIVQIYFEEYNHLVIPDNASNITPPVVPSETSTETGMTAETGLHPTEAPQAATIAKSSTESTVSAKLDDKEDGEGKPSYPWPKRRLEDSIKFDSSVLQTQVEQKRLERQSSMAIKLSAITGESKITKLAAGTHGRKTRHRHKKARVVKQVENVDGEYEVEAIRSHRTVSDEPQFLLKWKGYPDYSCTWESQDAMHNCRELLEEYAAKHGLKL